MNFRKHRIILTLLAILLLIGISVSAVAVSQSLKPDVSSGSFQNLIADRIEIIVENTEFTIKKASDDIETVTLTMFLSVKKTQADFYGMINSITFSGISYDNIVFTALNEDTENKTPDSLILGAKNGNPDTYKWQIDVTFSVKGKGSYPSSLSIDCISGMSEITSAGRLFEIPIGIEVE